MVQGYCLKEKKKVEIKDPKFELNKKGRPVVRGKCPSCGGAVYKILKAEEVPAELKSKISKRGGRPAGMSRSRKSKSRKTSTRSSRKSRKSKSRKTSTRSSRKSGKSKSRKSRSKQAGERSASYGQLPRMGMRL